MKIIPPSIEVVFHLPEGSSRLETFLETAGRTCYKSEDSITPESADRFIAMLNKRGHHAMLEHCVASARLICDRGVTHELVRHRIASYAQESTRYCDYTKKKHGEGINVIEPEDLHDDAKAKVVHFDDPDDFLPVKQSALARAAELLKAGEGASAYRILRGILDTTMTERQLWEQAMRWADQSYRLMRATGSPPQRARHVLPIGVKTEIVITTNLREWQHIFRLRCAPTAHPHIRKLMLEALDVFAQRVPTMFQEIKDSFQSEV